MITLIREAVTTRDAARDLYERACVMAGMAPAYLGGPAAWIPASSLEGLLAQGLQTVLPARFLTEGKEISNLQELVLYGIKGVAAYAAHALALGAGDPVSFAKIHEFLDFLKNILAPSDICYCSGLRRSIRLQVESACANLNQSIREIVTQHPSSGKVFRRFDIGLWLSWIRNRLRVPRDFVYESSVLHDQGRKPG